MDKCIHCMGEIEKNEIGEEVCFCELTDKNQNITLGECLGNCDNQEERHIYVVVKNDFEGTKILGVFEKMNSELITGMTSGKFIVLESNLNELLIASEAQPV